VLFAALLYAVLSVVLFSPALLTGRALSPSDYLWFEAPWASSRPADITRASNVEQIDVPLAFDPWLRYARSQLPSVPLWNPYEAAGRPFLANEQSAVFSPFSLPAYVLPLNFSYGFIAALKTWVAALGMFLFARALRMRTVGSLLAGTAYGFNLLIVAWSRYPQSSVWALIPWLLLSTEMLVRRPSRLTACGLAAATALQYLGGHPESNFMAMMTVVAYATLRLAGRARQGSPRSVLRPLGLVAGSLVLGTALAAMAIIPFVELLDHSIETSLPPGGTGPSLSFRYIVALMTPYFEGGGSSPPSPLGVLYRFIYIGALPLLLAGVALVGRKSGQQRWIAAFGLVCLLVALGVQPLFSIVDALPGFHQTDLRILPVVTLLVVALLAGFGADLLASPRRPGRPDMLLPIGWLVVMAVPLVWLGWSKSWSWLIWSALAGGLVAWRLWGRLSSGRLGMLAVALTAVNLLAAGINFTPANAHPDLPVTGAIAYLRSRVPSRFVAATTAEPFGDYVLEAAAGMNYGLFDARSHDPPIERRYYKLWTSAIQSEYPAGNEVRHPSVPGLNRKALAALDLLSVSDILVAPGAPVPRLPGLHLAYSGTDADVYSNDEALPRAFVVSSQTVIRNESDQLGAVERPGFPGRRLVVTDRMLTGIPLAGPVDTGPAGSAHIVSYAPEKVRILAHANRDSVLVLTDDYFPGWVASVNGRPAKIARVDYLLRGVRIGAGTSTVTFSYQPSSWKAGWIMSLAAFAVWLGMLLSGMRARRRRRAAAR
jgi:hypothetical protein